MLPSGDRYDRRNDSVTPRKRTTTGGGAGSEHGGGGANGGGGAARFRASAVGSKPGVAPFAARRSSIGDAAAQRRKLLLLAGVGSLVIAAVIVGAVVGASPRSGGGGGGSGRRGLDGSGASALSAASEDANAPAKSLVTGTSALDAKYCASLPTSARLQCTGYIYATQKGRAAAAAEWQKRSAITHACAGLMSECLAVDAKSAVKGASSCRPLAEGAVCRGGAKCSKGLCGGSDAFTAEQAAAGEDALSEAKRRPSGPAPPPPVAADPRWPSYAATVLPDAKAVRVPETFLATSHEWDRITDYADALDAFKHVFAEFGPSPILRMGGASQDFLKEPPPPEIWLALARMHREFNARYLIGLPLWKPDAIDVAKRMIEMAEEYLPKDAVLGYELGNEPEFWPTSVGGYEPSNPTQFVPGFDTYASYFARAATALNPCGPGKKPILSGPGWGNVNTIDAAWLAQQAKAPGARCYMRELSVHYYPYVNNDTIDARGLLDQSLQDFGVSKFNWLGGVAKATHLPLRISETNSLYGGGRAGLSDTMAGTMWCADALFAFASAGAVGFHFHWGFGGRPIHGGQPNTGVQTNFFADTGRPYPSIHAPWYGYLLFRLATAGEKNGYSDATLVAVNAAPGDCRANIKVWGLRADGGDLRVAILNKDADAACNVVVTVEQPEYCGKPGELSRLLPGPQGLKAKSGITWRGQTYDSTSDGRPTGAPTTEVVAPAEAGPGRCTFTVPMPVASGAVLEVPRA